MAAPRAKPGPGAHRYWVEGIDTTGLFELPSRPPRERFTTRVRTNQAPGTWTTCTVEVLDGERVVGSYDRNYALLQTFEPFRQGDRLFALISRNYTATSVMDLETGEILASEETDSFGFWGDDSSWKVPHLDLSDVRTLGSGPALNQVGRRRVRAPR